MMYLQSRKLISFHQLGSKFNKGRYISMSKPTVESTTGNTKVESFDYNSLDYLEPRFPGLVNKQGLNILRAISSIVLLVIWVFVFAWTHPITQFVYMTMWGNTTSLITSFFSLYITIKGTENVGSKIKKWNYLLLEFVFSMEMVITVIYWTVLHDMIMAKLKAEGNEHGIPLQIGIHSVPLIAVCCNVVLSKVRFDPGSWKITFVATTIFMFVNYGGKEFTGKPLYPFLPWDGSFRTYFNAVFLVLISTVLNYLCSRFIVNMLPLSSAKPNKRL
ncbi:hypothetical protein FGO68_gene17695 [Halteria grandinella]|uniref:Uncharacterized protein n=1 Tax=Halteria grandinella TaxID=5974 RepID=A0A8J8NJH3_HALGN|nr:hypothetical protein FGO68_gene17695 [Halteria grandinella]